MSQSQAVPAPPGEEIGTVTAFFARPSAAIVKLVGGPLRIGDRIWVRGHTTDLNQTVESMQLDHQPVTEGQAGQEVAIQLSAKARRGDRVYKIA